MNHIVDPNEKKEEPKTVPVQAELPQESVLRRIVPPHPKKSRLVTEADIDRVVAEAKILHAICFQQFGLYAGAFAMHHSQIDDKDPLSLFVTHDRKIVINPVITNHTNHPVDSSESCMSFPDRPPVIVPRWHKLEVEYVTLMVDPENKDKFKLSSKIEERLSGHNSFVFSHEIDHGEGKFIYQY